MLTYYFLNNETLPSKANGGGGETSLFQTILYLF